MARPTRGSSADAQQVSQAGQITVNPLSHRNSSEEGLGFLAPSQHVQGLYQVELRRQVGWVSRTDLPQHLFAVRTIAHAPEEEGQFVPAPVRPEAGIDAAIVRVLAAVYQAFERVARR